MRRSFSAARSSRPRIHIHDSHPSPALRDDEPRSAPKLGGVFVVRSCTVHAPPPGTNGNEGARR
jgi:hypothetical protein